VQRRRQSWEFRKKGKKFIIAVSGAEQTEEKRTRMAKIKQEKSSRILERRKRPDLALAEGGKKTGKFGKGRKN